MDPRPRKSLSSFIRISPSCSKLPPPLKAQGPLISDPATEDLAVALATRLLQNVNVDVRPAHAALWQVGTHGSNSDSEQELSFAWPCLVYTVKVVLL